MASEQLAGLSTGRGASHPRHPRDTTCRPSGFTSGKLLKSKCFLALPTERMGRYLLLLFVYIKKQVNTYDAASLERHWRGCSCAAEPPDRHRMRTCGAWQAVASQQGVGWSGNVASVRRVPCAPAGGPSRAMDAVAYDTGTGAAWGDMAVFGCTKRGGDAETAETLEGFGAPGWDRTSNPCLRRAVLYPLSYGRKSAQNVPAGKSHRIACLPAAVHRVRMTACTSSPI